MPGKVRRHPFKGRPFQYFPTPPSAASEAQEDSPMAAPHTAPAPQVEPVLVRYSDMEPKEQTWLWPDIVPVGCLTLFIGEPGTGKSLLAADLAARVSRGMPWPPPADSAAPQGSVLLVTPQDSGPKTVRPRLLAAGADLGRVVDVQTACSDGTRPFSLPGDLPALERAIESAGDVRLVVVDPLEACVAGTARSVAFRDALAGLEALAERTDTAVVAVTRLHGGGRSRTQGDLAALGTARSVWSLARGTSEREYIYLLPVKCNFAAPENGLVFVVDRPLEGGAVRLMWDEEPVEVCGGEPVEESQFSRSFPDQRHERWMRNILASGPVPADEVAARAERDGLWASQVEVGKRRCGVVERQDEPSGPVLWALPAEEQAEPDEAGQEPGAESEAEEDEAAPTAFSRGERPLPVGRGQDQPPLTCARPRGGPGRLEPQVAGQEAKGKGQKQMSRPVRRIDVVPIADRKSEIAN